MTTLKEEQLAVPGDNFQYYIDQYKIMHAEGYTEFYQISPSYTSKHQIKEMLDTHGVKHLLDYGISSGTQYTKGKLHEYLGLESFTGYDPAVEQYSKRPEGKFEGVLCYDVLEHVPESSLDYVIKDIFSFAEKMVMFKMGLALATAKLPNGDNAHVTVKPLEWWREKIKQHKPDGMPVYVHFQLLE